MLRYLWGFLLFLILMVAAYYFIGLPPSTIEEKKNKTVPIVLGFIGPLSGDSASYNASIRNSIELAASDLRTQGKQIDIFYEDGKCSGDDARAVLSKLISEHKVSVVIGGICSGETLAMAPLAEERGVVLFSPSASSPDITKAGVFIFRNNPSDASGGRVLGNFLAGKYKNSAIISENNDFSQNLRRVFLETHEESGGQISVDEVFLSDVKNGKDFKSIISKIKKSEVEAILIIAQTESAAGLLVKEIGAAKIGLPLYSHLLPTGSKFLEVAGSAADGIIFTDFPSLDISNARTAAFLEDYKKNYGPPNQEFYMTAAYDAVNILTQAIEKVGGDPVKVRDYLYNLSEYDGLIGKYSFDLNGDVVGVSLVLKKINDGQVEDYIEN